MKSKLYISFLLLMTFATNYGQEKYLTKNGHISFFSSTVVEDIKADNHQVLSIVDTASGQVVIAVLMKSFLFDKSLMQEHFNENYVESDRYPKAKFKGVIANLTEVLNGAKEATITGDLTLHGVTQNVTIVANCELQENKLALEGKFVVKPENYNIKIPAVVKNNIAKTIEVSFELNHKPYTAK